MEIREIQQVEQIDRRWRPALMAYFMRRVRDKREAEDLTQEVLSRMLATSASCVAADSYVFQTASNLLADRARRAKVRARYQAMAVAVETSEANPIDPHRELSAKRELSRVVAVLNSLPERQRRIFVLYRLEHMKQQDIAETFGISVSAVKKNIAAVMTALMASMREGESA